MADYLPNVSFNRRGLTTFLPKVSSSWFGWQDTLETLRPGELTVNDNRGGPMTVLRDAFRKYIVNTPMQNTTLGIEILYTDRPDQISPKRIFIVRRVRPGQPEQEFKIVNNTRVTRPRGDYVPTDEPFERSGTVFRNNQIRDVVKKLRRKNILQISLCEVYNDAERSRDGSEYSPYTMEVKVLYRNISQELVNRATEEHATRQQEIILATQARLSERDEARQRENYERFIRENNRNPNQLHVVPAPNPVPVIGSASYPDKCVICQEPVVGEGCRVNCPAGHIYHCECINEWRNTRATNTYFDTHWQNGCTICRQPITQMYHVNIPEGFTTGFGRRIKRSTTNSGMSLKTIDRLIKLVQKM